MDAEIESDYGYSCPNCGWFGERTELLNNKCPECGTPEQELDTTV
jgi:rubrerythrin